LALLRKDGSGGVEGLPALSNVEGLSTTEIQRPVTLVITCAPTVRHLGAQDGFAVALGAFHPGPDDTRDIVVSMRSVLEADGVALENVVSDALLFLHCVVSISP
jgi:hypothetical protein